MCTPRAICGALTLSQALKFLMAENLATLDPKARGNRIMVCSWLQCVKESVKKADTVKKGKSDGSEVAEMVCKRPRQQWIEAGERADTCSRRLAFQRRKDTALCRCTTRVT